MPLDTIYLVRHGHRLNWTIDYKTGEYFSQFPTPTGNPADPTLTSHGVRQSHELAAHVARAEFQPKPFRIYSSPFYRCLQTIQPCVEELKRSAENAADLDVRIENGLGEWFGSTTFFDHPLPSPASALQSHFPTILSVSPETYYKPHLLPSPRGETIPELHDRAATALAAIIADIDREIQSKEAAQSASTPRTSKAILICSHAATLIAMGRALTGRMPEDSSEEDFYVFTAGLSTFRRRQSPPIPSCDSEQGNENALAEGTRILRPDTFVPIWRDGSGVAGGWDCVANSDCSFLSAGAERGWHFSGEESFNTGPMAPSSATPVTAGESSTTASLKL
ncbi:hypothetical protein ASPZODRAFT_152709 [Penicilliopsis zonata CBS 506.65]|uniref:Phosphoglycerate mutase family protein n=1 Tax=Penicilliopsis zonata CBS 506.65 TaxID=1073090 RepID=A0A1L9SEK9_9EURO|nr:hypothetical protein ASPZODRAFT_152709 [Penicilliopsis zonata CBS 506.65]OJJ45695.1 hypothetical protein ASPZODRAFT_152709 [Penicilliopsis zonata CBS 506.65]